MGRNFTGAVFKGRVHGIGGNTYIASGYKKKGALQECPVTIEEIVQRFITELENQGLKYEAYFKMSLATSMRRSEACSLQWSDSRCCISGAMW